MTEIRNVHPKNIIYFNGKKIVEYYGFNDKRNFGEAEIHEYDKGYFIPSKANTTTLEYEGKEYQLDMGKCEMPPTLDDFEHLGTGTTTYKLFSKGVE